jgi:hypothetical protein
MKSKMMDDSRQRALITEVECTKIPPQPNLISQDQPHQNQLSRTVFKLESSKNIDLNFT